MQKQICQEIPDDLDSDTQQGPQHFTTSATRSDRERASCRETVYFPVNCGLKNNNFNTKSTNIINPTKGLDKVEDLLAESYIQLKTLESNNVTITNRIEDNIGHFAHKNTTFGNKKPNSLQDILTCPRVSIESVVCLLLTTFRPGCMLRNISGPSWLGSAHA